MFVGVADHAAHARQSGNFFRSALRVASGDDNFCQRILSLHSANGSAGILIGGIRDCARIQDDEVGLSGGGARQAAGFELAFESGAVGLGGAAAEVFHVVSGHTTIVAQAAHSCAHAHAVFTSQARALRRLNSGCDQAEAIFFFCVKHSRQKMGRPWVGRKGTVVSLPH